MGLTEAQVNHHLNPQVVDTAAEIFELMRCLPSGTEIGVKVPDFFTARRLVERALVLAEAAGLSTKFYDVIYQGHGSSMMWPDSQIVIFLSHLTQEQVEAKQAKAQTTTDYRKELNLIFE